MDASSLEVFKACLGEALRSLVWLKMALLIVAGLYQMVFKVPSSLAQSVIL